MLRKIIDQIKDLTQRDLPDPSSFQDPVAMRTAWTPLCPGGSNFKTAVLHKINEQRMEFRASVGMKLMAGIFVIVGLGIGVDFALKKPVRTRENLPVVIGIVFAAVGAGLLRSATTPTVFDLRLGYFCRSRKKPELMMDPSKLKRYAELKRVHALQVLSEHVRGKKSSYHSHELNLVLDDGTRVNVVDHGNRSALLADAETLSKFLNKPLWDAGI